MAVGDIFQLEMQSNVQNRKVTNSFGWEQILGSDSPVMTQLLARSFESQIVPLFLPLIATDVQLNCLYVRRVSPTVATTFELPFEATFGTASGLSIPNDSPWVISWKTSSNSSKNNGRSFMYGIPDGEVIDGDVDTVFVAGSILPFIGGMVGGLGQEAWTDATFAFGIIDRFTDGLPLVPPLLNIVESGNTDQFIKSQSRRRTRETRGANVLP